MLICLRRTVSIAQFQQTQILCKRLESSVVGVPMDAGNLLNPSAEGDVPLRDLTMNTRSAALLLAAALLGAAAPQGTENKALTYADMADIVSMAPVVAIAGIEKAKRLKGEATAGLAEHDARFLVTARTSALLRGSGGLPPRIEYLLDVPLDARGKPPKLAKSKVIVAAIPVSGKPDMLQLVSPNAQIDWTPGAEVQTRSILTEAVAADSPPRITGVGNAFHVRGSLPGESETQIFLKTVGGAPVSLNVLRRPGETPQWAVALGEMIDEAAKPPSPQTLLWYRLACFLPSQLPASSVQNLSQDDAAAAAEDYQFVIDALGRCDRSHPIAAQKDDSSTPTPAQSG